MTTKQCYKEHVGKHSLSVNIFLLTILITCTLYLVLLILTGGMAFNSNQVVDVPVFGSKLCESKGLAYNNYTMKDKIPYITCTDKTPEPQSIYDGVVTYNPKVNKQDVIFDFTGECMLDKDTPCGNLADDVTNCSMDYHRPLNYTERKYVTTFCGGSQ